CRRTLRDSVCSFEEVRMQRFMFIALAFFLQSSAFAWETYPATVRAKKTDPIARMQPAFEIPIQPEDFVWQTQVIEEESSANTVPVYFKNPSGYLVLVGNTSPGQVIEVEEVKQQHRLLYYSMKTPLNISLDQGKVLEGVKRS